MPIPAADVASLSGFFSAERLSNLVALTGSPEAAIELHQETLQAGCALMAVTASIEIALRNAVYDNLGQHFAALNWLQQPPVGFTWRDPEKSKIAQAIDSAKRDSYAKLNSVQRAGLDTLAFPTGLPANLSHLRRVKARRRQIVVTDGKVIAELTLYFWKRLYGPEYEASLWRTTLKKTFPDKRLKRADIATQLEHIYQSRNRIAHHEPVLHQRFAHTITAIEFVTQRLGLRAPNAHSPLATMLAADLAQAVAKTTALHAKLDAYRT